MQTYTENFICLRKLFQKYDRNSVLQIFLKSEGDDISSKYNKKDDREIENCYMSTDWFEI